MLAEQLRGHKGIAKLFKEMYILGPADSRIDFALIESEHSHTTGEVFR